MKPDGLTWPLAISAWVHVTLLGIPLVAPKPDLQTLQTPALEVILLNARLPNTPRTPPERALALSSTHSLGGGDAERGRARAPRLQTLGSDQARVDVMQDQLGQLQLQQQALLGQLRQQAAQIGRAHV